MIRARTRRHLFPLRWPGGGFGASGARRVLAEDGPYAKRLYQGLGVDDPYRVAVCANMAPNASVAGYAAVLGEGTALVGTLAGGDRVSRVGALLTGLCHGLAEFGDNTQVSVSLPFGESELVTGALQPGGPSRYLARRLRELAPSRQVAEEICAHLRRLRATAVRPPATGGRTDTVPQQPLPAAAFRLAWYARHLAGAPQISLERALGWLATVAVLDEAIEQMRGRLAQLDLGVDLGNGAAR